MRHPLPQTTLATARRIDQVYAAPGIHWVGDGFRVMGFMAAYPELAEKLDPFILIDYAPPFAFPPTPEHRRGVGSHPHRGFETVTMAFEGSVAHHDSTGAGGVIGPGDVQWMSAAAGILHKEYHEDAFARRGGVFHMAQLWVNLPAAHKLAPPRYNGLLASQMGVAILPDGAGQVRVVAGEYAGAVGPAPTYSLIHLFEITLVDAGEARFAFAPTENVAIIVMEGEVAVNGGPAVAVNSLVMFANEGEDIVVKATAGARLLLLGGEPIGEDIVQYGPFVMNTEAEIEQAVLDFNAGKFGHLD